MRRYRGRAITAEKILLISLKKFFQKKQKKQKDIAFYFCLFGFLDAETNIDKASEYFIFQLAKVFIF